MNVQQFLQDQHVSFEPIEHAPSYSAEGLAHAVQVAPAEVAKTVLLRADDDHLLAVLPADRTIDVDRVAQITGARHVDLATEAECGRDFSDCELGAIPPFGSQYGMKTLLDESLLLDDEIVFEGNSHQQAIRMKCENYRALERPIVGGFTH